MKRLRVSGDIEAKLFRSRLSASEDAPGRRRGPLHSDEFKAVATTAQPWHVNGGGGGGGDGDGPQHQKIYFGAGFTKLRYVGQGTSERRIESITGVCGRANARARAAGGRLSRRASARLSDVYRGLPDGRAQKCSCPDQPVLGRQASCRGR